MALKSLIPVNRERGLAGSDWQPFAVLQREIDRLFDSFSLGVPALNVPDLTPRMNVAQTDKEIEITAELPGLEEKDVHIDLVDNILTIKGEKKTEMEQKDKNYTVAERSYGSFSRSLELPAGVDSGAIKASIAKGVLTVTVSKPTPAQAKKIEIKSAA